MELEFMNDADREGETRTAEDLSRYFRNEVLATAEVLYEEEGWDP